MSGKENRCELCGEDIRFRHVYAPNAPTLLPLSEFLALLLPKAVHILHTLACVLLTAAFFLFLLPVCTAYALQLCLRIVFTIPTASGGPSTSTLPLPPFRLSFSLWWTGIGTCFMIAILSQCVLVFTAVIWKVTLITTFS